MAKDKLTVASSDPVSLDETKTDAKPIESEKATDKVETDKTDKATDTDKVETETTEKKDSKADSVKAEDSATKDAKPAETKISASGAEEAAPPRPSRPLSPMAQVQKDLKDAFPQIDDKYIHALLIASEGRVDPAFNGLLYLSDPTFKPEPVSVPQQQPTKSALTDDELLARQLQQEFDKEERRRRRSAAAKKSGKPQPVEDGDESPDELEQIKREFTQGFEDAKTTLNSWVSGLTKKFGQEPEGGARGESSPKLFGALGGSSFNSNAPRRNKNFDEDPEILSSDFSRKVNLKDDDAPKLPKRSEKGQDDRWQPLNSDVPVNSDAFLVTDSEDEDKK